jgi:anaerobic magnesium-protoporphyrin IX monomethyl ester cyclase
MSDIVWKHNKDFRVLLVYPNIQMSALMPLSMGLFTALLKREGYIVDLFDCTFYTDGPSDLDDTNQEKVKNQQVLSYDWSERGVVPKTGMIKEFNQQIEDFKPDLIVVSVLESTYYLGLEMMKSIPKKNRTFKTLFGGVFATYAPEKVIKEEVIDMVCRGEGEVPLVDLCKRMAAGESIDDTPNLWVKKNGSITKNGMAPAIDINLLPFPDWDLFEPQSIYRPMQGKIYRAVGMENQRGCPYTCAYCNSPSNNIVYKNEVASEFYRKKNIKQMKAELDFLVDKHKPELIYFLVDTFLAMSSREFDEFKELYMDYKIPFWMNTRAETLNEHRAQGLEDMNMLRMSIGIEHGNADYREKYLSRKVSDELTHKAFKMVADKNYTTCANSIIGMPDETRELIFDTINLNRSLPDQVDATGAFIWAPYHGTPLRDLAVKKGYISKEDVASLSNTTRSMLTMPTITKNEIQGLARTFSFYVKFPKERYSEIKIAEKFNNAGNEMFEKLSAEFTETYRGKFTPV